MSRDGKKKGGPAFVQVYHWMMETAAWRDLDPVARSLYVELKRRYTGINNGSIGFGAREAGAALGVHFATANRAFKRLRDRGFIVEAVRGRFGNGYHVATEWALTEAFNDRSRSSATKDFLRWRPVAPVQPKIISQVANTEAQVAPVQPNGIGVPLTVAPAQPSDPISPVHQLHQRDTSTSSHRHWAAPPVVVAPPPMGRVNEDRQAIGSISVGDALASSKIFRQLCDRSSKRAAKH